MKNNIKKYVIISILVVIVIVGVLLFMLTRPPVKENHKFNITHLSQSFIENYFREINNVEKEEDKENMLIVISLEGIKDSYGATKVIEAPNNQYILQYNSERAKIVALEKFYEDDYIISVEENTKFSYQSDGYNSWGITKTGLNRAIDYVNTNSSNMNEVTVAILDSGLDVTLFNKYYNGKLKETYNVLENSTDVSSMADEEGHGTHIAGTIAEGTPDNVKILPVKLSKIRDAGTLSPKPYGPYMTDIIAAINYIVYNKKADVLNMSFSSHEYDEALDQAIEAAKNENIITVAAAGNFSTDMNFYPAAQTNTISVSGVDSNLNRYKNSAYGQTITFTAPAVDVKSIMSKDMQISFDRFNEDGEDDFETLIGTSHAAPHVVCAVAILKSINKNLTLENIIELLKEKAIDLGDPGWDQYFGYGFISFENAEFCNGVDCDEYGVYKVEKNNVSNNNSQPENNTNTTQADNQVEVDNNTTNNTNNSTETNNNSNTETNYNSNTNTNSQNNSNSNSNTSSNATNNNNQTNNNTSSNTQTNNNSNSNNNVTNSNSNSSTQTNNNSSTNTNSNTQPNNNQSTTTNNSQNSNTSQSNNNNKKPNNSSNNNSTTNNNVQNNSSSNTNTTTNSNTQSDNSNIKDNTNTTGNNASNNVKESKKKESNESLLLKISLAITSTIIVILGILVIRKYRV